MRPPHRGQPFSAADGNGITLHLPGGRIRLQVHRRRGGDLLCDGPLLQRQNGLGPAQNRRGGVRVGQVDAPSGPQDRLRPQFFQLLRQGGAEGPAVVAPLLQKKHQIEGAARPGQELVPAAPQDGPLHVLLPGQPPGGDGQVPGDAVGPQGGLGRPVCPCLPRRQTGQQVKGGQGLLFAEGQPLGDGGQRSGTAVLSLQHPPAPGLGRGGAVRHCQSQGKTTLFPRLQRYRDTDHQTGVGAHRVPEGPQPATGQSPQAAPAQRGRAVQTRGRILSCPGGEEVRSILFLPPGPAVEQGPVPLQGAFQKQPGEGGVGVKVPLGTEDGLQIEQQLSLQPLFPPPAQLHPAQFPVFPPGDRQCNVGGKIFLLQGPARPGGVKLPAVVLRLIQGSGGQAHDPVGAVQKDRHPGGGVILPHSGQGDGGLSRTGAGEAVVTGQQAVTAVAQQVAPGVLPAEPLPLPDQGRSGGRTELCGKIPFLLLHDGSPHRHPLLKQLPVGGHVAVPHEPLLHHIVPQNIVDGHQAHPQMVGHIGAHHLVVLMPGEPGGGVIHRLVQPVPALQAHVPQAAEVAQGAPGSQQQGQEGGVGGDHQLGVQPPLQPQCLNAVSLVLIVHAGVEGVESGFRNAPGAFGLIPPALLGIDTEGQGLIQEGIGLAGQQKVGHEILEHGARPGGHTAVVVVPQQHPAQPPPVAGGNLPLGHRDKAGLPGLAGHQVVEAVGEAVPLHLTADGEQPPLPVEEGSAVHGVGQGLRPPGQGSLSPLVQPLPQGDEAASQVAAVHRGHIPGAKGDQSGGVIPVVQVSVPLVQPLHRIQDVGDQLRGPLPGQDVQIGRRHHRQQGHADIGGGGPPGQDRPGLLLPVVRREVVVLLPEKFVKIPPDEGGLVEEERPVGGGQRLPFAGGAAYRPGQGR